MEVVKKAEKQTFTYQPLGNSVLIEVPAETKGGILLPETIQDQYLQDDEAIVVETGPDCKYVKKGDRIKLYSHAAKSIMRVDVRGKLYMQFAETLVAGIVKNA